MQLAFAPDGARGSIIGVLRNPLRRLPLLVSIVPFAFWCFALGKYGVDIPQQDQWDTPYDAIVGYFDDNLSIRPYVKQHNEARKVVPTTMSVLLSAAGGSWNLQRELFIGFAVCVLIFAFLWRLLRRTFGQSLYADILLLSFSLSLWSPLTIPFHLFSITFERLLPEACVLAAALLLLSRIGILPLALGFAGLAVIAQYSFPGGLVVWLLLLILLVGRSGEDGRSRFIASSCYVALGFVSVAAYFWTYRSPSGPSSLTALFEQSLLDCLGFVLVFLGKPWATDFVPSGVVGSVALGAFAYGAVRHLCRGGRRTPEISLIWIVIGMYSVSQGLLAMMGRLPMSISHALRVDYISHGLYLPVAAFVLLWMPVREMSESNDLRNRALVARIFERVLGHRSTGAARSVACCGLVFLNAALAWASIGAAPTSTLRVISARLQRIKACAQLVGLYRDDECLKRLYASPERIVPRLHELDRLSAIQPGLVTEITPDTAVRCEGAVKAADLVEGGLDVSGWALVDGETADAVVLAGRVARDSSEKPLAVFRTRRPRKKLAATSGRRFKYSGWRGTATLPDATASL